jgi:hypothetical protein
VTTELEPKFDDGGRSTVHHDPTPFIDEDERSSWDSPSKPERHRTGQLEETMLIIPPGANAPEAGHTAELSTDGMWFWRIDLRGTGGKAAALANRARVGADGALTLQKAPSDGSCPQIVAAFAQGSWSSAGPDRRDETSYCNEYNF